MQVTIPPSDTIKNKQKNKKIEGLTFTFLALVEDNQMKAVIPAVWPFSFIAAY